MPLLELTNTLPIILIEIDSLSSSTHTSDKLYFSNSSFITEPGGSLSNTSFNPRIDGKLTITSDMLSKSIGSLSSSELNSVTLGNADGELDSLLTDYLLEGRGLVIKYGNKGIAYADFTTVFTGILSSLTFTEDSVSLLVSNYNSKLDVPIASQVYSPSGGSGYNTFNTSLHGKRLPVTYGVVKNVTPHYVRNILVGDTSTSTWDPYLSNVSTLSNNDLTTTCTSLGTQSTFSRIGARNGSKRYLEFHTDFSGPAIVGVASPSTLPMSANIGSSTTGVGFSAEDGGILVANVLSNYSSGYLGGSIIGVAIDGSSGSIWFSKNGVWIGDPAAGTGAAYEGYLGDMLPGVTMSVEGDTAICKFKASDLTYSAPTGFNEVDDTKVVVSQLHYKVHDDSIFNVICVHSDGVDLPEDQYVPYLDTGEFQVVVGSVGSTRITADIQGDVYPEPLDSAAAIITEFLLYRVSNIALDSASVEGLATPYFAGESIVGRASCGSYHPDGETLVAAVEEYMSSFNLQGGFDPLGVFSISVFKAPNNTGSLLSLSQEHIEKVSGKEVGSPQYATTIGYAHNYTKFSTEGIAASVLYDNPDQFSFMLDTWRVASATNNELGINGSGQVEEVPEGLEASYITIQDRYLNAKESKVIPSVIFSGIDALLEAKRRWRMNSSGGGLVHPPSYQVSLPFLLSGLSLNNTVHTSYPRFSLTDGTFVTIVGISLNLMSSSTILTVWDGAEDSFTLGQDINVAILESNLIEYLGCTPIPTQSDPILLSPYGDAERPFGSTTGAYAA